MNVNGVTDAVANSYVSSKPAAKAESKAPSKEEALGVSYTPSADAKESNSNNKVKDYSSIVSNLKSEMAKHQQHLQDLVNKLLTKQSTKFTTLADMYKNLEVDEQTRAEAEEEIGEDGYWGVEKTSDRLVAMAQALSGGDPAKADTMIDAIKKGFKQAGKEWGDDLPDICKKTVDTAIDKLNKWRDGITDEQ